jgi:hypothetical protein
MAAGKLGNSSVSELAGWHPADVGCVRIDALLKAEYKLLHAKLGFPQPMDQHPEPPVTKAVLDMTKTTRRS